MEIVVTFPPGQDTEPLARKQFPASVYGLQQLVSIFMPGVIGLEEQFTLSALAVPAPVRPILFVYTMLLIGWPVLTAGPPMPRVAVGVVLPLFTIVM